MIKRKLALLGTAVAVSLLMTVPAFAADTKDTDTAQNAQNAQNTQSVQEEKTEENTGYVTCSVLNVRRASSEKSDKVGTLKRGEEVKILRDEENGWYAIDSPAPFHPYLHQQYILSALVYPDLCTSDSAWHPDRLPPVSPLYTPLC